MGNENFVRCYDGVYEPDVCNEIIQYFEQMSASGFGVLRDGKKIYKDDQAVHATDEKLIKLTASKNLTNYVFDGLNKAVNAYVDEFDILSSIGDLAIFDLKMQKTNIGGGYHSWHFESGSRRYGNRVLVYTIYLNDVAEGGETEFLYCSLRVKPTKGSVLLFPAGFTHTHRGNPPISNEKYIITGWVEL